VKYDPAHPGNRLLEWPEKMTAENAATAVRSADYTLARAETDPGVLYNVACIYSLASGKAAPKKHEYADRAMELLHKAVQAGFRKVDVAKTDPDLNPLRGRADFKQWYAKLEADHPPPEVAPMPRERK
jgi:hypothetical protein